MTTRQPDSSRDALVDLGVLTSSTVLYAVVWRVLGEPVTCYTWFSALFGGLVLVLFARYLRHRREASTAVARE